jgi:aspartyl/glutamyl-tRNA(Asn/Gln) amidotransferase C subunit
MSNNTITVSDVQKVSNLSRLSPNLPEIIATKFQKNLSDVLNYADQLSRIDTSNYSPHTTISTVTICDLRDDATEYGTVDYLRIRNNILNNFPARQGDFLQLPVRIVEDK